MSQEMGKEQLEQLKDSLELLRDQEGFRHLLVQVREYQLLANRYLLRGEQLHLLPRYQGKVEACQFVLDFVDSVINDLNTQIEGVR